MSENYIEGTELKGKEGTSERLAQETKVVNFQKDKIIFTLDLPEDELEGYEDALKTNNPVYLGGTTLAPLLRQLANLANVNDLSNILNDIAEKCEMGDLD